MLYASRVKLFGEMLELFTHTMFQLVSFQGPKMMEVVGVLSQDCREDREYSPPHCCSCFHCAKTGLWCGIFIQEDLIW